MASFLTGPAVHLMGAGMQAIGVGIPVSETSSKVIDGMRSFGLPVPPKTWFKSKDKQQQQQLREDKKNVYETLESHIQGVMQVVKPALELKNIIVRGSCKSGDCASKRDLSTESPKEKLEYCTPQKCTSGNCNLVYKDESDSPQRKIAKRSGIKVYERRGSNRRRSTKDSSDEEDTCIYCSRSRSLIELPCGRLICSKCDKNVDHDLESNMPRTRNSKEAEPQIPNDIIDLTTDSPSNTALRRSRTHGGPTVQELPFESENVQPIILPEASKKKLKNQRLKPNKPVVINLDETIILDDSTTNANMTKVPVLSESSNSSKQGLFCPICFDSLADENIKTMTTPCGHIYCLECLKTVTQAKKKCSICQRPITFAKCIRLHI